MSAPAEPIAPTVDTRVLIREAWEHLTCAERQAPPFDSILLSHIRTAVDLLSIVLEAKP